MAGTQAVFYRDANGAEPVDAFIETLPAKRAAKIDDFIEEHLNGRPPNEPPSEYSISSQIEGELQVASAFGCALLQSGSSSDGSVGERASVIGLFSSCSLDPPQWWGRLSCQSGPQISVLNPSCSARSQERSGVPAIIGGLMVGAHRPKVPLEVPPQDSGTRRSYQDRPMTVAWSPPLPTVRPACWCGSAGNV